MKRENLKDKRYALIRTALVNAIRSKLGMTKIQCDIIHKNNSKNSGDELVKKLFKNKRKIK